MLGSKIFALASLVLGAFALPVERDTSGNYTINLVNNCKVQKSFAGYVIQQPSFTMELLTKIVTLPPKGQGSLSVPFSTIGLRLSSEADKGLAAQWNVLQLVEFGATQFSSLSGTSYDISMMGGSDRQNWLSVCPVKITNTCQCKHNDPSLSPLQKVEQVWTAQNQVLTGSKADTTCMSGKQDFTVTWC